MKKLLMGALFTLLAFSSFAAPLSKGSTGIPYSSNGKVATFGEGSQVARPNGTVPSGSGQIGSSGWYYGTGAAVNPATGQTMTLGANGEAYIAGTKYPFQAGYQVPAKSVAEAALGVVGGWPALTAVALLELYPHLKDWLKDSNVSPNPNSTGPSDQFLYKEPIPACNSTGCYKFTVDEQRTGWHSTPEAACRAVGPARPDLQLVTYNGIKNADPANNKWGLCSWASTKVTYDWGIQTKRDDSIDPDTKLPKSLNDIAPYLLRTPFKPQMIGDVISGGGTVNLPDPSITGPTQIQGQPSTTTSTGTQTVNGQQVPTRTETTTQTTYNFTTNNNQVTNTTNTTTTTTNTYNQSSGVLISTDTTEKTETPEEKEQPNDSPLGPVPKLYDQKYPEGLTGVWNGKKSEFSQTSFFTMIDQLTPKVGQAGSCPSWTIDLSWTPGGSMGVHQLQPPCMIWPILKTIVIITALFLARALIFGG